MIHKFQLVNIQEIQDSKPMHFYKDKLKVCMSCDIDEEYLLIDTPIFCSKYDYNNNSKYGFKIYFDPPLGRVKDFYEFLIAYEVQIAKKMKVHFKNFEQKSVIEKEGDVDYPISYFNVHLISRGTVPQYLTFDVDGSITNIENLKVGNQFKCILDISEIWVDLGTKKYGINIKLLQMKLYHPIFYSTYFMLDDGKYHPTKVQTKVQTQKNIDQPPIKPQIVKFMPDLSDIIKMKQNLKKN